jgi:dCMP deaminase
MNLKESKKNQLKWDDYFHTICHTIATNSPCLSRQVGAILVRDRIIIASGYNGPPRGIPHCGPERNKSDIKLYHRLTHTIEPVYGDDTMCPRQRLGFGSGDGLNFCPAAHAEDNCITNAARIGVATTGATLYLTGGTPCKDCLKKIINAGIVEIVCESMTAYDELSTWLLRESEITIRIYKQEEEE